MFLVSFFFTTGVVECFFVPGRFKPRTLFQMYLSVVDEAGSFAVKNKRA